MTDITTKETAAMVTRAGLHSIYEHWLSDTSVPTQSFACLILCRIGLNITTVYNL